MSQSQMTSLSAALRFYFKAAKKPVHDVVDILNCMSIASCMYGNSRGDSTNFQKMIEDNHSI